MRARVGDRLVVAPPTTGAVVRDGEIVEVRGTDGGPPYLVRWSDSGHTGLYFPGTDAHVAAAPGGREAPGSGEASGGGQPGAAVTPSPEVPRVRSWRVDIDLFESGDDTSAHAVLVAESPVRIEARGQAHREPSAAAVPEIGDEVAVARALRRLADRLLGTAAEDLEALSGHPTTLTP
jgi:hypothetical protein